MHTVWTVYMHTVCMYARVLAQRYEGMYNSMYGCRTTCMESRLPVWSESMLCVTERNLTLFDTTPWFWLHLIISKKNMYLGNVWTHHKFHIDCIVLMLLSQRKNAKWSNTPYKIHRVSQSTHVLCWRKYLGT